MKTTFIALLVCLLMNTHAQTTGDRHNQTLSSIITNFTGQQNIGFTQVYDFAAQLATQQNLIIPSFRDLEAFKDNYVKGKSCDQMIAALETNHILSPEFTGYVSYVLSEVRASGNESTSSIDEFVSNVANSSAFAGLGRQDKQLAAGFNDVLSKSFSFWQSNEDQRKKSCRFSCLLCVATIDAIGTALFGPVGGAALSAVARCCGCNTCGGVNCG